MSYNPSIPIGSDPILQSARQIRANFQAINSAFSDNHVGPTQSSEIAGMHEVLTMRPQPAMSLPVTSAIDTALYNTLISSIPELFFAPNNAQTPIQLTYPSLSTDPSLSQQYSFVAGPFIIYGGLLTRPTTGANITLSPGSTLLYVDLIMTNVDKTVPAAGVTQADAIIIGGTTFSVNFIVTSQGHIDLFYFAVGI